jgi:hypothetical protein
MTGADISDPRQQAYQRALAVKHAHEQELLGKPNVVGVGVGLRWKDGLLTDSVALVVMVTQKLPQSQLDPAGWIPGEIDGVPVDVQEVGELKAA